MTTDEKIKELENDIHERILDHYYADSWEQARQISEDIRRMKAELAQLKKKVIS